MGVFFFKRVYLVVTDYLITTVTRAFQINDLHLQPKTSQPQLPEPLSGGAAEPDQSCLQEELHLAAEEKVTTIQ